MSARIQSIIKFLIALLAVGFIVWKLMRFENLPQAWELFTHQVKNSPLFWLVLALIGIPVNFGFEIAKWNLLIRKCYPLSYKKATRAVFSGLTMAMLTPNRIGEIFSRVFVLPKEHRTEGIGYSGVNILAQRIIVQLFGLIGMGLFLSDTSLSQYPDHPITHWVVIFAILLSILIIGVFMNLNWITWLIRIIHLDKRFPGLSLAFKKLKSNDKWMALALSAAKYATFNLQFYFLIRYFGVDIPPEIGLPAIMTIYLLLNFIPVISIGEVGVRGSVTLLILGLFSDAEIGILVAALFLWILNIGLPALAGSLMLRKIKF